MTFCTECEIQIYVVKIAEFRFKCPRCKKEYFRSNILFPKMRAFGVVNFAGNCDAENEKETERMHSGNKSS